MEINKQLQTLDSTKTFLKWLSETCRKNLLVALDNVENPKKYRIIQTQKFERPKERCRPDSNEKPRDQVGQLKSHDLNKKGIFSKLPVVKALDEITAEELLKIDFWNLSLDEAIRITKFLTEKRASWKYECFIPVLSIQPPRMGTSKVQYSYDYELSPGQK